MSVPASTWTDWFSHGSTASDSLLAHSQDPARAIAGAGLLASAFPIMSASIFRATEAGTRAFMIRFSRPGMILDRFTRSALTQLPQLRGRYTRKPRVCDKSALKVGTTFV